MHWGRPPPHEQNHRRLWKYYLAPTSLRAVKITFMCPIMIPREKPKQWSRPSPPPAIRQASLYELWVKIYLLHFNRERRIYSNKVMLRKAVFCCAAFYITATNNWFQKDWFKVMSNNGNSSWCKRYLVDLYGKLFVKLLCVLTCQLGHLWSNIGKLHTFLYNSQPNRPIP